MACTSDLNESDGEFESHYHYRDESRIQKDVNALGVMTTMTVIFVMITFFFALYAFIEVRDNDSSQVTCYEMADVVVLNCIKAGVYDREFSIRQTDDVTKTLIERMAYESYIESKDDQSGDAMMCFVSARLYSQLCG